MAINDSVQLLSMILDNKTRKNEAAAQRGHEMTMTGISLAQRNLENQINMNFQRQQNVDNQIANLRNNLSQAGVEFGQESDLGNMVNRVEGSLVEQRKQLGDITQMKEQELESLYGMQSAFSQGMQTAMSLDAEFDENLELNPQSEFGMLRSAVGNTDSSVELLQELGITDIGEDPRQQQAFVAGANQVLQDYSNRMEQERSRRVTKMQIDAENRARAAELDNSTLTDLQLRQEAKKLGQAYLPNVEGYMSDQILAYRTEDADVETMVNERVNAIAGAPAGNFTASFFNAVGLDPNSDDKRKYTKSVSDAIPEMVANQEMNMAMNPESFMESMSKNIKDFESTLDEYNGDLASALENESFSPRTLASIVAFVSNSRINPTVGVGFERLQEIANGYAANRLLSNKNPKVALDELDETLADNTMNNIGVGFRAAFNQVIEAPRVPEGETSSEFTEEFSSYARGANLSAMSTEENLSRADTLISSGLDSPEEIMAGESVLTELAKKIKHRRTSDTEKSELENRYDRILRLMERTELGKSLSGHLKETQRRAGS